MPSAAYESLPVGKIPHEVMSDQAHGEQADARDPLEDTAWNRTFRVQGNLFWVDLHPVYPKIVCTLRYLHLSAESEKLAVATVHREIVNLLQSVFVWLRSGPT